MPPSLRDWRISIRGNPRRVSFLVSAVSLRISRIRLCFCTIVNALTATATSTGSAIKKRSATAESNGNVETNTNTDTNTDGSTDTQSNADTTTDSNTYSTTPANTDENTGTDANTITETNFLENDDSNCGLVCPGNSSEICGGPNSALVYSTGIGGNNILVHFHPPLSDNYQEPDDLTLRLRTVYTLQKWRRLGEKLEQIDSGSGTECESDSDRCNNLQRTNERIESGNAYSALNNYKENEEDCTCNSEESLVANMTREVAEVIVQIGEEDCGGCGNCGECTIQDLMKESEVY